MGPVKKLKEERKRAGTKVTVGDENERAIEREAEGGHSIPWNAVYCLSVGVSAAKGIRSPGSKLGAVWEGERREGGREGKL